MDCWLFSNAGVGYFFGSYFVGALAYADNLVTGRIGREAANCRH